MRHNNRWIVVVPIILGLPVAACKQAAVTHDKTAPAHVEHVDGTELSRVTLTPKAAERLGIQTAAVREVHATSPGLARQAALTRSGSSRKAVPYAAVLYDANGNTWVYT